VRGRVLVCAFLLAGTVACFAKDYSGWLKKVPQKDRVQVNPYAGQAAAIAAGANLYRDNCAKCHGEDAEGRPGRPSLRIADVRQATDGDLAWILKNGQMFKGMPSWGGLPEQERWQLVAYLRSLNMPEPVAANTAGAQR
jgi:mono/diheme cytochrome c family protein